MDETKQTDALLRERDVKALTGLSKSTRWRMIARGEFPRPCRVGQRVSAWRAPEAQKWLASRQPASGAP